MTSVARATIFVVITGAAALATSAAAAAPAPGDKAAAQSLFDEAYKLMAEGKFADACPKLEESARIDPAMGTRFRLAECNEAIGKTASAWAGFVEVADLARAAGQDARERVARERAEKLRPSLARLKVAVEGTPPAGLEIRRDGGVIGAAQWGAPIPVDPGIAHITATAPGHAPWSSDVPIPRSTEPVVVRIPALALAAPNAEPHAPADDERAPESTEARRVVGITLVGVGGAAVVASGVLGLVALRNYDKAGEHCHDDLCDPQGKSDTDAARGLANVATWIGVGGGVLAASGAVLWITSPSRSNSARASVRARPGGVVLEGTF